MSYVLGIDKGTTTTKASIFDVADGRVVATARRSTTSFRPRPEWHEEDMEGTYGNVAAAIREALASSGIGPAEIVGVGVSGHMGGLWALDVHGAPACPAIAWPDSRAAGLLDRWKADGRVDRLFEISGDAPFHGLPLVLLAWLKENDPDFYARIDKVMLAKDYVNYRLTGVIATENPICPSCPAISARAAIRANCSIWPASVTLSTNCRRCWKSERMSVGSARKRPRKPASSMARLL